MLKTLSFKNQPIGFDASIFRTSDPDVLRQAYLSKCRQYEEKLKEAMQYKLAYEAEIKIRKELLPF